MNKNKKITIITSSVMLTILVVAAVLAVLVNQNNISLKKQTVDVVIYQCQVVNYNIVNQKEKVEHYRAVFNKNLTLDETIYALEDETHFNHVVIKNGTIYIKDTNCMNKYCKNSRITYDINNCQSGFSLLLNPVVITCQPHGIIIMLEETRS